jgi:hypothetical protein
MLLADLCRETFPQTMPPSLDAEDHPTRVPAMAGSVTETVANRLTHTASTCNSESECSRLYEHAEQIARLT